MTEEDLHEDVVPANELELVDAGRAIEFVPADYFARQKLSDIFPREAPLEIDLGSGEGAFIRAMAARHPERNFLGVERLLGRVRKVCRAIARDGLTNARIVRIENAYALRYLLPLGTVSVAHVGFPDPWPKRYHQRRRLMQDGFMEALHGILVDGGELRVKTDDLPYFQWMEKVFARARGYECLDWPDDPDYPITNFERRFVEQGLPIYRARLRKVPIADLSL
jgi:tRNA (guanine-N7-)-methyltransferase